MSWVATFIFLLTTPIGRVQLDCTIGTQAKLVDVPMAEGSTSPEAKETVPRNSACDWYHGVAAKILRVRRAIRALCPAYPVDGSD